jgi:thiol-disulfide isomerase/thioredoxin
LTDRFAMLPPLAIGPLMIPPGLWLLVLMAVSAAIGMRLVDVRRGERHEDNETLIFWVVLGGLLAARLGFVVIHFDDYRVEPWSILNVRDGGWHLGIGLVGAAATLWRLQRRRHERVRALNVGAYAAMAVMLFAFVIARVSGAGAPAPLPDLQLRFHDGATRSLRDDRPQVINLWATWCPPCRREMPALIAAAQAHPEVRFVFANQGEDADTIAAFLREHPIPPNLLALDPEASLSAALGVRGYPTTLFVDAEGRIVERRVGELSRASLSLRLRGISESGHGTRGP